MMDSRRLLNVIGLAIGSRAHRKEIVRRIRSTPVALVVTFRTLLKWRSDKRSLPLTRHHFGLYLRIHRYMWRTLGRFPDLVKPDSFNDAIQWLKLFDQSPAHVVASDKVAVKELVTTIDSSLVSRTIHVLENALELHWVSLVQPCVIKASHDSGSTVLARGDDIDTKYLVNFFSLRLRSRFGLSSGEWSYSLVRPRILVEEILPEAIAGDLPDFKFHCVDGRVAWLQYIFGRFSEPKELLLDRNAQPLGIRLDYNFSKARDREFERPSNWSELIRTAEMLAADWKYVRVDLYNSNVGIRFGELTFFPYAGCYAGEGQLALGPLMTFDRTTFRPPLTRRQRRNILKRGVVPAGNRVPA